MNTPTETATESSQFHHHHRRYTVAEIDRMRVCVYEALVEEAAKSGSWIRKELEKEAELKLRTYLLAGVAPESFEGYPESDPAYRAVYRKWWPKYYKAPNPARSIELFAMTISERTKAMEEDLRNT